MSKIKSSIKIEGEDKVLEALKEFINDTESEAGNILLKGAEMLKAEARALAPVSKTGKTKGKYQHPPGTLRDSIEVGEVRRKKGRISAAVGIAENKYFTQGNNNQWYARWVEFGTNNRIVKNYYGNKGVEKNVGPMPASPFMRPALVKTKRRIRALVRDRLKEELFDD